MTDLENHLFGTTWFHSHEEDTPTEMVFRSSSFQFPPSRGGRIGFELRKDGTAEILGPGPTDKPSIDIGKWTLAASKLDLHIPAKNETRTYDIKSSDPDRLLIHKP